MVGSLCRFACSGVSCVTPCFVSETNRARHGLNGREKASPFFSSFFLCVVTSLCPRVSFSFLSFSRPLSSVSPRRRRDNRYPTASAPESPPKAAPNRSRASSSEFHRGASSASIRSLPDQERTKETPAKRQLSVFLLHQHQWQSRPLPRLTSPISPTRPRPFSRSTTTARSRGSTTPSTCRAPSRRSEEATVTAAPSTARRPGSSRRRPPRSGRAARSSCSTTSSTTTPRTPPWPSAAPRRRTPRRGPFSKRSCGRGRCGSRTPCSRPRGSRRPRRPSLRRWCGTRGSRPTPEGTRATARAASSTSSAARSGTRTATGAGSAPGSTAGSASSSRRGKATSTTTASSPGAGAGTRLPSRRTTR